MPADIAVPIETILRFGGVLARTGSVFVFVPWPGVRTSLEMARIVLIGAISIAAFPSAPEVKLGSATLGWLLLWFLSEVVLGLVLGLLMGAITESALVGAQVISLQAGFSYASAVDPTSPADSGVLLGAAQMAAALCFFALGLHREVIRIFIESLRTLPPGTFLSQNETVEVVLRVFTSIFTTALRLALPLLTLLLMVDLALALLGRMNMSIQLFTLSFPVKIFLAIMCFAAVLVAAPALFSKIGNSLLVDAARILRIGP